MVVVRKGRTCREHARKGATSFYNSDRLPSTPGACVPSTRLGLAQSRWVPSLTVDSKPSAVRRSASAPLDVTERDPRDAAGLLLGRLTVLPALVLLPFLLTSFPLLLIGLLQARPGDRALAGAYRGDRSVCLAADSLGDRGGRLGHGGRGPGEAHAALGAVVAGGDLGRLRHLPGGLPLPVRHRSARRRRRT